MIPPFLFPNTIYCIFWTHKLDTNLFRRKPLLFWTALIFLFHWFLLALKGYDMSLWSQMFMILMVKLYISFKIQYCFGLFSCVKGNCVLVWGSKKNVCSSNNSWSMDSTEFIYIDARKKFNKKGGFWLSQKRTSVDIGYILGRHFHELQKFLLDSTHCPIKEYVGRNESCQNFEYIHLKRSERFYLIFTKSPNMYYGEVKRIEVKHNVQWLLRL